MPKHGWKWRTEWACSLSYDEMRQFLWNGHCSVRLARWVYENLPDHRTDALQTIGFSDDVEGRKFLWRELEKWKGDEFGDWVVVALGRSCRWWPEEGERFLALYEDKFAHAMTRGSAVYGMMNVVNAAEMHSLDRGVNPMSPQLRERIREACKRAIRDDHPYARSGAVWLGQALGDLEEELSVLRSDHSPTRDGGSLVVADHFD